MRLISAHIKGYGRLVDAKVNLDSKLIAIVGPNEAGKTTLLKALAYLNNNATLGSIERSRAVVDVADDTLVIKAEFVLEENDKAALGVFQLQQLPLKIFVSRKASGGAVQMDIEPYPCKATEMLKIAVEQLEFAYANYGEFEYDQLVSKDTVYGDPGSDAARHFPTELDQLIQSIRTRLEKSDENDESDETLAIQAGDLIGALAEEWESDDVRNELETVRKWAQLENPVAAVRTILWERTPNFLLFDEADRTLQSSYTLDEALIASVPPALANLSRMAKLDLEALGIASRAEDIARRDTELIRVNKRLAELFAIAWKQSRLSVSLSVDGSVLRVSILEDGENITVFSERSAGLRMFVALVAFLATRDTKTPPILLIDEAENHLHIDAQADLVNMFIYQEQATRVIYTTHSPACLPPDLGVGIRSVSPLVGNQQKSEIRNSFWTNGPGYSPLMIAMGAAAAAFTPARCVVLGEGATEMILLPSLLRSATGQTTLPYQVAPGLSEVPKDFYQFLDFEGAKVAYLLDSDSSGNNIRKALLERGVPENRIVMISVPGLENVLPRDVYCDAVSVLLIEHYSQAKVPSFPELVTSTEASWATQLRDWCVSNDLVMPSKVSVASRIIEDGMAAPSEDYVEELVELHARLMKALEI